MFHVEHIDRNLIGIDVSRETKKNAPIGAFSILTYIFLIKKYNFYYILRTIKIAITKLKITCASIRAKLRIKGVKTSLLDVGLRATPSRGCAWLLYPDLKFHPKPLGPMANAAAMAVKPKPTENSFRFSIYLILS